MFMFFSIAIGASRCNKQVDRQATEADVDSLPVSTDALYHIQCSVEHIIH